MSPTYRQHDPARWTRRGFLALGGGLAAATWPATLPTWGADAVDGGTRRATSCILVYLLGGPPHLDTFDLKPAAPSEIRGPFRPISTAVPGTQICEHLPHLAEVTDQFALVRSISHPDSRHTPMIYYTLTGRHSPNAQENDVRPPLSNDDPHWGSVIASRLPSRADVPDFVSLPDLAVRSSTSGEYKRARSPLRGGRAGFLGMSAEPLLINDAPESAQASAVLQLPDGVPADRFESRVRLLELLNRDRGYGDQQYADMQQRAVVLTGHAGQRHQPLFSLDGEPPAIRERYGSHRFGQTMLMARRLTEAGVRMVAIHFNEMTVCDGWDTHANNFDACRQELLPMLDQSLSALIQDLRQRGRLDETLIVCMGEFGRTPKINKDAGRDHWGPCSTTLLAGGGIVGGRVLGESDKHGAYPVERPIDPVDVQATVYHCLGLRPHDTMRDTLDRPVPLSTGHVIHELL